MNFWQEIDIRTRLVAEITGEIGLYSVCNHSKNVKGFKAKNKYGKEVKKLVEQVEMLRQMPHKYRDMDL